MNTTCNILPAALLIARSSAKAVEPVESNPEAALTNAKAGSFPWEAIGVLLVFMIATVLVGLWSWTLVEFLRFFVETMPQPNGLEIVLE